MTSVQPAKYRSVCGYPAEIRENSSERNKRLLVPGQLLYQAQMVFRDLKVIEYTVIAIHEREVYIYPTKPDTTYPGKLIGWKSVVFNDNARCYFEHKEDALNMFIEDARKSHDLTEKAVLQALSSD